MPTRCSGWRRSPGFQRSIAAEAPGKGTGEIPHARGLVVTVVESYYNAVVTQRMRANAQAAAGEAQHFVVISRELEHVLARWRMPT